MAGHDYLTAQEVDVLSNGSQDWRICGGWDQTRRGRKGGS